MGLITENRNSCQPKSDLIMRSRHIFCPREFESAQVHNLLVMERDRSSSHSAPSTEVTTPETTPQEDGNEIWESDNEHGVARTSGEQQNRERVLSDLPTVKRQHMTDGYREGLSIGKAKVMQKGFDEGYPIGVSIALRAGKVLGCIEGILTAGDVPSDQKESVQRLFERAKRDLALSFLLKDMSDQLVMQSNGILQSVEKELVEWENLTFGNVSLGESSHRVKADDE